MVCVEKHYYYTASALSAQCFTVVCIEKLAGPCSKQVEPLGSRRNNMLEFKKDFIEIEAGNVGITLLLRMCCLKVLNFDLCASRK